MATEDEIKDMDEAEETRCDSLKGNISIGTVKRLIPSLQAKMALKRNGN